MVNDGDVGKKVIANTKNFPFPVLGGYWKAEIVSFCDVPSVIIKTKDGSYFQWRADLCEILQEIPDAKTHGFG